MVEGKFLLGGALLINETTARQMFGPRIPAEKFGFVRLMLATSMLTAACSQVAQPTVTATERPAATATFTPEPSPTPTDEPTATVEPTLTPEEQLWADLPKHLPEGLFEKEEEKEALVQVLLEAMAIPDIHWQRAEVVETYTGFDESAGGHEFTSESIEIKASYIDALQVEYQGQQVWCVIAGTPTEPIFLYGGLVQDNPRGEFWIGENSEDMSRERVNFTGLVRGRSYKFFVFTEATDALFRLQARRGYVYSWLSKENTDKISVLIENQSEQLVSAYKNRSLGGSRLLLPMYDILRG